MYQSSRPAISELGTVERRRWHRNLLARSQLQGRFGNRVSLVWGKHVLRTTEGGGSEDDRGITYSQRIRGDSCLLPHVYVSKSGFLRLAYLFLGVWPVVGSRPFTHSVRSDGFPPGQSPLHRGGPCENSII